MKYLSTSFTFIALLFGAVTAAKADFVNPFSGTYGYNTIVFNDMKQYGVNDVEGQLAVGNNLTTNGNFGVNLQAGSRTAPAALYVGGHLHTGAAGWQVKGDVYYKTGTTDKPGGNQWWQPPVADIQSGSGQILTNNPLDFGAMESGLRASASTLSALQNTVGVTTSFSGVESKINVGGGQQVVNIDLSKLYNGSADLFNLKITGNSTTTLLINLVGDGTTALNMFGGFELFGGLTANHVVINFVNVDSVNIYNTSIKANLLGVDTDLVLASGNIEGINVFDNAVFNSQGETHNTNFFDGGFDIPSTPPGPAATPEPSTLAVFGIGSLLGGIFLRRRNRNLSEKA